MDFTLVNETCQISKVKFFNSLSIAADIFERIRVGHCRRVAYTSVRLSSYMKLPIDDVCKIYYAAILHDVGIGFAYNEATERIKDVESSAHEIHGKSIVMEFLNDIQIGDAVYAHHENWNGTGPFAFSGDTIPLFAQIIRISDYIDNHFDKSLSYSDSKIEVRKMIAQENGKLFSEEITEAFLIMSEAEGYWLDYKNENINFEFRKIELYDKSTLELDQLIKICSVYGRMVDEKSIYTLNHSKCIAESMLGVSKLKGLSETLQKKAYISGLIHDLGKATVISSVINKPGPLTIEERNHVNSHPYYTRLILESIPGFEDITQWAANHHELLNGKGYPNRKNGDDLDYFSRLLTVCDIYQALSEDRSYRKAMSTEKAWDTLCEMRDDDMLCPEACSDLKNYIDLK
jgi:HD-GYP domain-containing protein (c-di-GMP phosphodiesterase class II)